MLRLEIEKLQAGHLDFEDISESHSLINDSFDLGEHTPESSQVKTPSKNFDKIWSVKLKRPSVDGKEYAQNGLKFHDDQDSHTNEVSMNLFISQ